VNLKRLMEICYLKDCIASCGNTAPGTRTRSSAYHGPQIYEASSCGNTAPGARTRSSAYHGPQIYEAKVRRCILFSGSHINSRPTAVVPFPQTPRARPAPRRSSGSTVCPPFLPCTYLCDCRDQWSLVAAPRSARPSALGSSQSQFTRCTHPPPPNRNCWQWGTSNRAAGLSFCVGGEDRTATRPARSRCREDSNVSRWGRSRQSHCARPSASRSSRYFCR